MTTLFWMISVLTKVMVKESSVLFVISSDKSLGVSTRIIQETLKGSTLK